MRLLPGLAAALSLAAALPAFADFRAWDGTEHPTGWEPWNGNASVAPLPAPSFVGGGSGLWLGRDNDLTGNAAQSAVVLPALASAPAANCGDNWEAFFWKSDENRWGNANYELIAGPSTASACGGGADLCIRSTLITASPNATLSFVIKNAGNNWWQGSDPTGIVVAPNTGYLLLFGQVGTGQFISLTRTADGSPATGSPAVSAVSNQASPTSYYKASSACKSRATLGNMVNALGNSSAGGTTVNVGTTGPFASFIDVAPGTFPNATGVPDAATLSNLATGKIGYATVFFSAPMSLSSLYPFSSTALSGSTVITPSASLSGTPPITTTAASAFLSNSGQLSQSAGAPAAYLTPVVKPWGFINSANNGQAIALTSVGSIPLSGTISNDGGGLPNVVQARLVSCQTGTAYPGFDWPTSAKQSGMTGYVQTASTFSGAIANVPVAADGGSAPTNDCVQYRYGNSTAREFDDWTPQQVGWVFIDWGQSQQEYQATTSSNAGTGPTLSSVANFIVRIASYFLPQQVAPTTSLINSYSFAPGIDRSVSGNAMNGTATVNQVGDGTYSELTSFAAKYGVPVEHVNAAYAGQGIIYFISDGLAAATINAAPLPLAGSGTSWHGSGAANTVFTWKWPAPIGVAPSAQAIKFGTFVVSDQSGAPALADQSTAVGTCGTLTPLQAGWSGSVNCSTGVASITAGASQSSPPTVNWVVSEDVTTSDALNSPLTGVGVWDLVKRAWAAHNNQPVNAVNLWQGTADKGSWNGPASTWATANAQYAGELTALFARFAALPNWSATTKFVGFPMSREYTDMTDSDWLEVVGARTFQQAYYGPGNANGIAYGGAWDWDTLNGQSGPHQDTSGGINFGPTAALGDAGAVSGDANLVRGPVLATATRISGTEIDLSFTLFHGTALSNVAGATTGLKGFSVRDTSIPCNSTTSPTSCYDDTGFDGNSGSASTGAVYLAPKFVAAIKSATVVSLTRTDGGTWAAACCTVYYRLDKPNGHAFSTISISVTNPGSLYTNGTNVASTATAATMGCTNSGGTAVAPGYAVSASGGAITGAILTSPGFCPTTPASSFPIPAAIIGASGTGGVITPVTGSGTTDANDLKTYLTDNSVVTNGNGTTLPGLMSDPQLTGVTVN